VPLVTVVSKSDQATSKIASQSNDKYQQKKTPQSQPKARDVLDTPWLLQIKATKKVEMACLRTLYEVLWESDFGLEKMLIHADWAAHPHKQGPCVRSNNIAKQSIHAGFTSDAIVPRCHGRFNGRRLRLRPKVRVCCDPC
jgi:hypothetical protein